MNTILTSNEVLELINTSYPSGQAHHCKLLRRGYNDNYLVGIDSDWFIFRVYLNHKYYTESPTAFEFELELLEHLRDAGVSVSSPIRTQGGDLLGWTTTSLGDRAFTLLTYAEGDEPSKKVMTPEMCHRLGKSVAELHIAANSFHSEHDRYHLNLKYMVDEPLRIIANDELTQSMSDRDKQEIQEMIESLQPFDELTDLIKALPITGDEYGIIHGDLHPGNMHVDGDHINYFDFDHCAYGWRAYELCVAEGMPEEKRTMFFKGYESVRPLSKAERECIPVFAKLRRLWDIGDYLIMKPVREIPE